MNYGALVSETFWLTLRNRFLWFFGFLLGGGQVFNLLQNANSLSQQGIFSFLGYDVPRLIVQARRLILDNLVLLLGLAVALVLVCIFLSFIARGALVDSVAALHRGEERNFSSAFRAGLSNVWRMLGFSVLVFVIFLALWLPIFFVMLFSIFGLFARIDSSSAGIAIAVLAFLFFFVVFLLIFIPLGLIFILGLQALVLNRGGVFGSLGSDYRLLVQRPGQILLVAVISFPRVGGLYRTSHTGPSTRPPPRRSRPDPLRGRTKRHEHRRGGGAVVALLILYLVAASAVATFNYAYWTLAYLQLTTVEGDAGFGGS